MSYNNRGAGGWTDGRQGGGYDRAGGQGGYRQGGQPPRAFPKPSDAELRAIVEGGDAERLVQFAEAIGRALAVDDRLATSQIRSVFSTVRQIEMNWAQHGADEARARRCHRELLLLRPKLAYQARRGQGNGVEHLRSVLDPAIMLVRGDRERFQNLVDFFEAILAYHRAHGGQ